MKTIPLTQGRFTTVSDEDFSDLKKMNWFAEKRKNTFYANSHEYIDGKRRVLRMHVKIMSPEKGCHIDHVDGNGLNNTRSNLRVCSVMQNAWNSRIRKANSTGYRGVYFHKKAGKYAVQIRIGSGRVYLGLFSDSVSAAKKYDSAARKYHGEFARLNFPEDIS